MEQLPMEIIKYILSFDRRFVIRNGKIIQINRIEKTNQIYNLLLTIPEKNYDPDDQVTYVYMNINEEKDYFLSYLNYEIQLQTFRYEADTRIIHGLEGHRVKIV